MKPNFNNCSEIKGLRFFTKEISPYYCCFLHTKKDPGGASIRRIEESFPLRPSLVLVEASRWNSKKENDDKGSWSSSICRHELAIKGKWSSEASYSEWLFYCPDITLGPFDWARAVHCAVFEALKNNLTMNSLVFFFEYLPIWFPLTVNFFVIWV